MDTKKILGGILVFILVIILINLLNKHTITITSTKVVTAKQPNTYVVHTKPVYYPHYNPYKAQYYN
jgi:hypothetical protein